MSAQFDTQPIYALGNSWIAMGDLLYEQLGVMDTANTTLFVDWKGPAAT